MGIDYSVVSYELPLYQKAIAFVHRDLEMRALTRRIVGDTRGAETVAFKLLEWTHAAVRPVPRGFPLIDDHPYHIIVRGYGKVDQAADAFVNLAAYAGIPARLLFARGTDGGYLYAFGALEIDHGWRLFDVREQIAFRRPSGELALIDELRAEPALTASLPSPSEGPGLGYPELIAALNLSPVRPVEQQMPLDRLRYELLRLVGVR